jgi:hypothetical protein
MSVVAICRAMLWSDVNFFMMESDMIYSFARICFVAGSPDYRSLRWMPVRQSAT